MGLLFVMLFWAAVFCFATLLILLIVFLTGKGETRVVRFKRTMLGMVLFLIIAFTLNLISSSFLGTDLGIGDDFHVRIKNGYSLFCVDAPSDGIICKDHDFVISGVDSISVCKNTLYLFANNEYLLLDTISGEVTHNISKPESEMMDITSYYHHRYWITGGVGSVLSIIVAIVLSVFLSRKLIRYSSHK